MKTEEKGAMSRQLFDANFNTFCAQLRDIEFRAAEYEASGHFGFIPALRKEWKEIKMEFDAMCKNFPQYL